MIHYEQLTIKQLDEAASFIAKYNNQKGSHIGYCGTDKEEIIKSLQEDFIEGDQLNIFISRENNRITGLVGFDVYDGIAEVWGPFSSTQRLDEQLQLWHFALTNTESFQQYLFFINEKNTFQQQFLTELQAHKSSSQLYLKLTKEHFTPVSVAKTQPFQMEDFMSFKKLHEATFPNTYYSADTIVERLRNEQHQLLVFKDGPQLIGYIYFEMNGHIHSTHLEYIAVTPEYRGKGFGKQLLTEALTVIFTNEQIQQATLTVNNINIGANELYIHVGFQKQDALLSYVLHNYKEKQSK